MQGHQKDASCIWQLALTYCTNGADHMLSQHLRCIGIFCLHRNILHPMRRVKWPRIPNRLWCRSEITLYVNVRSRTTQCWEHISSIFTVMRPEKLGRSCRDGILAKNSVTEGAVWEGTLSLCKIHLSG